MSALNLLSLQTFILRHHIQSTWRNCALVNRPHCWKIFWCTVPANGRLFNGYKLIAGMLWLKVMKNDSMKVNVISTGFTWWWYGTSSNNTRHLAKRQIVYLHFTAPYASVSNCNIYIYIFENFGIFSKCLVHNFLIWYMRKFWYLFLRGFNWDFKPASLVFCKAKTEKPTVVLKPYKKLSDFA